MTTPPTSTTMTTQHDPNSDTARLAAHRKLHNLGLPPHPEVARRRNDPTPEMYAAVQKVLQHHGLTTVGDAVVEADLIHAVLSNHDAADTIEWLEKGNAEWRDTARLAMKHQNMASATASVAISHLQAVLNKARTHDEQQRSDTAARDWLISIGSEPT